MTALGELAELTSQFEAEAGEPRDRAGWEALRLAWAGTQAGKAQIPDGADEGHSSARAAGLRPGGQRSEGAGGGAAGRARRRAGRRRGGGQPCRRRHRRHPAGPPAGARQPAPGQPGGPRDRAGLRRAGLRRGRRPRGRRRLPQLRGAQLPGRPSGARKRRTPSSSPAGRPPLRTQTSPVQIRTMLSRQPPIKGDLPGAGLPQRQRPAPLADVPPGRRPSDRRRAQPGRHEGHPRRLSHAAFHAVPPRSACGPSYFPSPSPRPRST